MATNQLDATSKAQSAMAGKLVLIFGAIAFAASIVAIVLLGADAALRTVLLEVAALSVLMVVYGLFSRESGFKAHVAAKHQEIDGHASRVTEVGSELEAARLRMVAVFEAVSQGLFTINSQFEIEPSYSQKLSQYLRKEDLGGKSLLKVLEPLVTENTLATIAKFLPMLFDKSKPRRALDTVNPLKRIDLNFPSEENGFETRFLTFSFSRVLDGEEITSVLATVDDVTAQVRLEENVQDAAEGKERQIQFLLSIIRIDQKQVAEFVKFARDHVARINAALRTQELSVAKSGQTTIHRSRLETVYRSISEIKKKATTTNLTYFTRICQAFEDKIVALRGSKELPGDELLPVLVLQAGLERDLAEMDEVRERFNASDNPAPIQNPGANTGQNDDLILVAAAELAADLATKYDKQVRVEAVGFDTRGLPPNVLKAVDDIISEFIRNSISHGIESPADRAAIGKSPVATITIEGKGDRTTGSFAFKFRDDGNGLDTKGIRAAAVRGGKYSAADVEELPDTKIVAMIFGPGFTTAVQNDGDAARGFGLSVIKDLVIGRFEGKMGLHSEPLKSTEFSVSLPLAPKTVIPSVATPVTAGDMVAS